MKIGIFGGSFNPVHNEHVKIVLAAKKNLGLDKVIVVPTFLSPLKTGCLLARAKDRLHMCRLAFAGIQGVEVSDCEVRRGGVSYSYITCRYFRKLYKNDELYFIIGADALKTFHNWKQPEEILKCVTLAVSGREKTTIFKSEIKKFHSRFKSEIVTFGYVGSSISSTEIRALAALKEDVSKFVPEPVNRHIVMGQTYFMPEVYGVKSMVNKERWRHTVRVTVMAACNCRRVGVFEYDAIVAAALHDCAKCLSLTDKRLTGFVLPDNVPEAVIHQFSGAYIAEKLFGVKDDTVLNAIRYHTSARENMSTLEKLIFLTDMLEDSRNYVGLNELRRLFESDLDTCLMVALGQQIERLTRVGSEVYPLTFRAYEYLKKTKY